MTDDKEEIHAFIDAQNVVQATRRLGWDFDLVKLRTYLADKYKVTKAFYFIGYIPRNQRLYQAIQQAGFILQFKEVANRPTGEATIKGNVDVNLTLHAAMTVDAYDKAILVSADGDFLPLVQFWQNRGKFRLVLSPDEPNNTSRLLKRDAANNIAFMPSARAKIEKT